MAYTLLHCYQCCVVRRWSSVGLGMKRAASQLLVDPDCVHVPVPCYGKYKERFNFDVINRTKGRILFKVKVTEPFRFEVDPIYAFVEGDGVTTVLVQPAVIENSLPLRIFDHFTILYTTVLPGEKKKARKAWKEIEFEENEMKRVRLPILYFKRSLKMSTPLRQVQQNNQNNNQHEQDSQSTANDSENK